MTRVNPTAPTTAITPPRRERFVGFSPSKIRANGITIKGVIATSARPSEIETATGMGHTDAERDPRLNELEYFTLAGLLEQQHGVVIPTAREEFVYHLPKVFEAWRQGIIEGPPETFQNFEARVSDAMHDIAAGQGPALVITSGGLIAMTMRRFLGLEVPALARVALAIMNTSVHRLFPIGEQLSPVLFNAVPHLEQPDRHYAQTHL